MRALDSHAHLDAMGARNSADVALIMAAARAVGVSTVISAGDTVDSSGWAAEVAAVQPGVGATVAIHPNEARSADGAAYAEIAQLAALPQVVGVGETGLDYYWKRVEPAVQQAAFRWHIDLAKRVDKPLVIHDRDAHADILAILAAEGAPRHTIFHCFSGDEAMARLCVRRGYVLSFAGTVTFKNAAGLREAARVVPAGQLLVETDAPFLAPAPHRGRPNAPYLIPITLRALAAARGEPVHDTARAVSTTAARVFGIGSGGD